jgi:hypothetical protein
MLIRWIWRTFALFLGRKAWDAYQRRQGQQRSSQPGNRGSAYR